MPKAYADAFPSIGSHLERYAQRLTAVEINTSFYRPHRLATYERWAEATPEHFRVAVKLPRTITHELRLENAETSLQRFLGEIAGLGSKLGSILFQLPPSHRFNLGTGDVFLRAFRDAYSGSIVCEPLHPSWLAPSVDALLTKLQIARVAADPAPMPDADEPGGWQGLRYYRLHGSPKIYYSAYEPHTLDAMADRLAADTARGCESWCIFDNTAAFAATGDALSILERLGFPASPSESLSST